MTLDINTLKGIKAMVDKNVVSQQKAKEADNAKIRREVMNQMASVINPILNRVEQNSKVTNENLARMAKTIATEVIKNTQSSKALDSKIEVKIPKIDTPKIPTINVPKPEVTVNVPKADAPIVNMPDEMSVKGKVSLDGIDSGNPLSVQIRDSQGKPVDFSVGSNSIMGGGGSGKRDFFTIKGIEPLTTISNGVKTTTAGVAVQLSSTSIRCKKVTVVARTTNDNTVVVGGAGVVASIDGDQIGAELYAGSSILLDIDDLNKIWIDVLSSNDGVNYEYHY